MAEWNPEKDLLAMVTDDSKIVLHRFNWQRLWTISPGKCITSLCWRPDGKAIAVGLEDGTICLHDVENGKFLRSIKSHSVAVVCLNWEEDGGLNGSDSDHIFTYEDRTSRFFPPAPRAPRMPGVVSGDPSFMDENEDSFQELLNSSHQQFSILCSADKDGSICFSIFGIFPIGKINIHKFSVSVPSLDEQATYQILNASIYKVALSKDLCHLITMCSGEIADDGFELKSKHLSGPGVMGLHCLVMDTSIFLKRKNELYQVAKQASNIEDLIEIIRASLSVMSKQWGDAMHIFHEKFDSLSTLIASHGLDSSPQEEFLSLLGGARTSPPVHQFLVNSLGEAGLKRVNKVVHSVGKELQRIVLDHLQPAAEIVGFRMGELRGLSRWRARYAGIGLDETLLDNATEEVGMLLVQVERFMKILSSIVELFSNFFNWLLKCVKILMSEPSDQVPPCNSELVVIFLRFLYDQDPVRLLLEQSAADHYVDIDADAVQRSEELVKLGGFVDTEYLRRTLAKEFQHVEFSIKEAFQMPYATVSQKILCQHLVPLFPFSPSLSSVHANIPTSIAFYKDISEDFPIRKTCSEKLTDYVSFRIPDGAFSDVTNSIAIVRGVINDMRNVKEGCVSLEALLLTVPDGFNCVDLSLYKERQIVLILNESTATSDGSGNAFMMIVQASDLPFVPGPRSSLVFWKLYEVKDSILHLQVENEKARNIPHFVIPPLAVSSSRGIACVFCCKKTCLGLHSRGRRRGNL
ncbi:Anaphase-promoting complex subunit 4 [Ancistrocladus abbreviatus]